MYIFVFFGDVVYKVDRSMVITSIRTLGHTAGAPSVGSPWHLGGVHEGGQALQTILAAIPGTMETRYEMLGSEVFFTIGTPSKLDSMHNFWK